MIKFISGNQNKFQEIKSQLNASLEMQELDLDEIQELDPKKIIEHKLREALKHHTGSLLIEDTSLYLEGLNNLPGPLIKWFLQALKPQGLHQLIKDNPNTRAVAKTILGYVHSNQEIYFFEGFCEGTIVAPRGETNFGWDPIFQPEGYEQTFAEMTLEQKLEVSMRSRAVNQLNEFLSKCE